MNKFYITTPIYYVNDKPHIGHTYTTVAADVLARYHRMIKDATFFATGTDEHGIKIAKKAKAEGKEPQQFADEVAAQFQMAWDEMNISNDGFIRTTDKAHKKAVQNALQYMYDKGDIVKDKYEGLYCVGCEQFKNEKDLIDGKCPDHQTVPEQMSEETYVFKMSKYSDKLLKMIESDELKIRPIERKNEVVSFYKEGLKDVSFSRKNVKWGIPLPWDKSHTAYVWSDAFLNYLTILGWNGSGKKYPEMFPPDVQLMSKDILRVHATIWPAMLLSLDLPVQKSMLFVHGFFLIDNQKMSKSIGNVISPADLIKRYGVDATRYLLMSATPFGHDGNVSWEKFDEKYNADLANGIGNLVARVLTMIEKYFESKVPLKNQASNMKISPELVFKVSSQGQKPWEMRTFINWELGAYKNHMKNERLDKALAEILFLISAMNGYISEYQPFKLIKENKEKTAAVLYNCLESIRIISVMLWPFMPETAEKIWTQLGLNPAKELQKDFNEAIKWGGLDPGAEVKKGEALFPRLEK
ncbi:methionine--tRNA ligase [Candidatus Parcubacteria bacterium]|nr:methionine--tRNA ligase [Candidatus Parcubacteria bacterium]